MNKDEHNKLATIENHIWQIAKIIQPTEIIDSKKINEAQNLLLKIFSH